MAKKTTNNRLKRPPTNDKGSHAAALTEGTAIETAFGPESLLTIEPVLPPMRPILEAKPFEVALITPIVTAAPVAKKSKVHNTDDSKTPVKGVKSAYTTRHKKEGKQGK